MKKFYWHSVLAGLASGCIVAFLPYLIEPMGEFFGGFYGALASIFSAGGFPNLLLYFVVFFVWSLPFFVIFLLLPSSRRSFNAAKNKLADGLLSLILFTLGILVVYGVWLLFAFAAFSGSSLVF